MISCKHLYNCNDKLTKGLCQNICADYIPITITTTTITIAIEIWNWIDDTEENGRRRRQKKNEKEEEVATSRSEVFVVDRLQILAKLLCKFGWYRIPHTHNMNMIQMNDSGDGPATTTRIKYLFCVHTHSCTRAHHTQVYTICQFTPTYVWVPARAFMYEFAFNIHPNCCA